MTAQKPSSFCRTAGVPPAHDYEARLTRLERAGPFDSAQDRRPRSGKSMSIAALLVCLVAACAPVQTPERATRQAAADAVGSASAPTGGHRLLDDYERRRLVEAARAAFEAAGEGTTAFTVVPRNIDAEPTIVSAAPAGPGESRADGSTCRPIRLSATKHGRTTVGTLTFCRDAGTAEIKPAAHP
jgi:hypothetical protein